jgi:hypothetical protein
MPVKVDGTTVRGYKLEQFADAFARALPVTRVTGVTSQLTSQNTGNASDRQSVTGVTSESASQAGSNASNAYPVEQSLGDGLRSDSARFPRLGEPGLEKALLAAVDAGHITQQEALEQYELHKLILRTTAAEDINGSGEA